MLEDSTGGAVLMGANNDAIRCDAPSLSLREMRGAEREERDDPLVAVVAFVRPWGVTADEASGWLAQ
jgi:hypothetical protein